VFVDTRLLPKLRSDRSVFRLRRELVRVATNADWAREARGGWWEPAKGLLASIRDYQETPSRWVVLRHRFWSAVTGADIPLNSKLGGGLILPHPNGVVIHPDAEIGPNCLLFQQVTIGSAECGGVPRLGSHVDVGAGAKIIGPIEVGDHAKIGANAVVLIDVPARATAVGAPARIIHPPQLFATTDAEAATVARSLMGEATVAKWNVYREDGTNRIVVCRNFHAIEGPEVVEYLDEIDPLEAYQAEKSAVTLLPKSAPLKPATTG
jgi:serine O-acetyltransferase